MLKTMLVEDNDVLSQALKRGLEATGQVLVTAQAASGEDAVSIGIATVPQVVLMDVQLAGPMNGVQAAIALRREHPRLPIVFYSIQDDDAYYRDFLHSGILSHYAYVRKSSYLLPQSIVPLFHDAIAGKSFIEAEIESRVQEVRHKDANDPFALLEPNERAVAELLAQGLTNGQIATRLSLNDKRAVSRTNGQIYAAWGLNDTPTDEKVARTRAAIIALERRLIVWDRQGASLVLDAHGKWVSRDAWQPEREMP